MKTRVQQLFIDFADVTTLHGIRTVYMLKNKTLRILWIFILALAFSAFTYEVIHLILDYASEQIATSVRFDKMNEDDLLKVITPSVCFSDWMSKSKIEAKKSYYTKERLLALDSFTNKYSARLIRKQVSNESASVNFTQVVELIKSYQADMLRGKTTLEQVYQPIIKNFNFTPRQKMGQLKPYIILADTVCFNIVLDAATDIVGVPIFRKEVDLLHDDTVTELADIHAEEHREMSLLFYDGLDMRYISEINRMYVSFDTTSAPIQLNLRLRLHKITTLNRRRAPCQHHPPVEQHSKYPVNYAKQLFMQKCIDKTVLQPIFNCSCLVPRNVVQKSLHYNFQDYKGYAPCTADRYFEYETKSNLTRLRNCQKNSNNDNAVIHFCTEWTFTSDGIRFVKPRTCKHKGCINLAIVVNPTLEVSEQIFLMSFETFISNLGGQGGLWFGGSVLSIAQFIFFFIFHGSNLRQRSIEKRTLKRQQERMNRSKALLIDRNGNAVMLGRLETTVV